MLASVVLWILLQIFFTGQDGSVNLVIMGVLISGSYPPLLSIINVLQQPDLGSVCFAFPKITPVACWCLLTPRVSTTL